VSRRGLSAGGRVQEGGDQGDIDLTPMLDVVFIMLIFFIVASTFVKEPGVDLTKSAAETTEACLQGSIIFAVDSIGKIHYNKEQIPLDQAHRLAEAAKSETPKARFVIQADQEAPTLVVSELYDVVQPLMDGSLCYSTDFQE